MQAQVPSVMNLGDIINMARVEKHLGLRALARELEITPSYLSDIENNRRIPSEAVLRDLASALDLDFDRLMQRAGRVGEDVEQYLRRERLAGQLFRRIAASQLDEQALEDLLARVEEPESEGLDDEGIS